MGRIVVTEFMSLDGVVEDPGGAEDYKYGGWSFEYSRGDDGDKFKLDETMDSEALLLGRVTYEGFADAWPSREGEFADKFNNMPKYVVSTTLSDPEWTNSTVISGDLADGVARIKDEVDGDIVVHGSATPGPGPARERPRRRAATDGVPRRPRRGQAPVRAHERQEGARAGRLEGRRRRRLDPRLPPRRGASDGDAGAGGADADREGGVVADRSGVGSEAGLSRAPPTPGSRSTTRWPTR